MDGSWMAGWADGLVNGQMDGWIDGWVDEWINGWIDGRIDGWIGGQVIDGWVDGWMMEAFVHVYLYITALFNYNIMICQMQKEFLRILSQAWEGNPYCASLFSCQEWIGG